MGYKMNERVVVVFIILFAKGIFGGGAIGSKLGVYSSFAAAVNCL